MRLTEGMDVEKPESPSLHDIVSLCDIGEVASLTDRSKTLVITDRKIHSLYGANFPDFALALVPEGEGAKSWDTLAELYRRFISLKLDRNWSILAIGGGAVSDIAGFAAHTWMRGVRLLSAPTTLLAMTDAALGGKNGIDFQGYKNVVGSFHLPSAIFCDIETLRTLETSQFISGMAEVIKHAVIDGEKYFSFLEATLGSFGADGGLDYVSCPSPLLAHMVSESQRIKLGIVENDPREAGRRRILNLGHTFGHALEIVSGMHHGYAVSIGLSLACSFSLQRGGLKPATAKRILDLLSGYGLPVDFSSLARSLGSRVKEALFMDKKRDGRWMNLVIPEDIGVVKIEKVAVKELEAFLDGVAP